MGYVTAGGWECYSSKNWFESWDLCRQDGAVLIAMETLEEHKRLKKSLQVNGNGFLYQSICCELVSGHSLNMVL